APREHRRVAHDPSQCDLLLHPRSARGDRQGAGDDRAGADAGARPDPRLGHAVGARARLARHLEDDVLAMAARRILYFTASEHFLYRTTFGGLELEGRFAADDNGLAEFQASIGDKAGAPVARLADLAGEDFHEEQVPLLRGADREAVLARRLAQRYRDIRLSAALSLGPVTTGERRNERVLLASFTGTQQLAPW